MSPAEPRRWSLAAVAVLAAAAVLFFARLGDRAVVSEELRWAEVAREMRQTGDYLRPAINGRPYPDKPAGSYWLIVAASYLTGGVDEAAARLPAAAAGWVGVLLVMLLADRLHDRRAAVLAGAVLASSFGFAFYARRATADVETVTGVLAAVYLFARNRDRPAGPWVVGLWLLMAATSLTKGLLGFALPVAVLGTYGTWGAAADPQARKTPRGVIDAVVRGNRWLVNRWALVAVPLAGAVYLAPFLLAAGPGGGADGLAMVWRENVRRFFAPHNHAGPVWLYAAVIPVLAAPWSAFLPAALLSPRREAATDGDRLARAFFWAVFVFFTLSASRRSYYLLPVLPAVALLVGRVLTAPGDALRPAARRLRGAGYAVVFAGVVFAGAGLLDPADVLPRPWDELPPLPARWGLLVVWLTGLGGVAWAARRVTERGPGVAAGAAFAAVGLVLLLGLPAAEGYRTRRAFAAEVRAAAGPDGLALFHARDVVFDLAPPGPVTEYESAEELAAAVRAGRVKWVVARRRYLAGVALPLVPLAEEPGRPWDGLDQTGDKMVLLAAVSP